MKNHIKRFPPDFMFILTEEENKNLRCRFSTSKSRAGGNRYLPYVFTEQGIAMLSGLINTDIAVDVNISIMRAFVKLRQLAITHDEIAKQLSLLIEKYDRQFNDVFEVLNFLVKKEKSMMKQEDRKRIGF